jgi:hypothetical protein
VEDLSILGGTIRANGTLAGIGSGGDGCRVGRLTFGGTAVMICSSADAGKFPVNAASIRFLDASAVFVTPRAPLFGVRPLHQGKLNLTLVYQTAMADKTELLPNSPAIFLQILNLTLPPGRCEFCIFSAASTRWFGTEPTIVRSLIVSVPSEGNYSIRARAEDFTGFLAIAHDDFAFDVASNSSIVSDAYFVADATRTASLRATATSTFTLSIFGSSRQNPVRFLAIGRFLFWFEQSFSLNVNQ